MMNETLKIIGSFATIWLATWFFLFLLLWMIYPMLRKYMLKLHPAISSNYMLVLLSIPFLASLLSTTLLFSPFLEVNIFNNHTHTADCYESFPFLTSVWLVYSVLGITALTLGAMLWKFVSNYMGSKKLKSQLVMLGEKKQDWHLLPNRESLVFTVGWLKNTIFITEAMLENCNSKDIDIILSHENEHIQRKDNIRLLVARLLTMFIPANLARRYTDDLHLYTEAACDFATAAKFGYLDVADTLLKVQRLVPQRFTCLNSSLVSAFTGAEVESRIELLLSDEVPHRAFKFQSIQFIAIMLILTVLMIDPLHHGIDWLVAIT